MFSFDCFSAFSCEKHENDTAGNGTVTISTTDECNYNITEGSNYEMQDRTDPNGDGVFSLLTVGNSFSDDAMEYVYKIAESVGVKKIYLGNLYFGSCRIDMHYKFWTQNKAVYDYRVNENGECVTSPGSVWTDAVDSFDWDYICFQQSAQSVQTDKSKYKNLADLMKMAKEHCPNSKLIYHMPWPNPHSNYGNDTEKMYEDCMKALDTVIDKYGFYDVITTGTAIQNLRTSYIEYDKTVRDGWHLSYGVGRFTAGLAFFTQLTGISVENIGYRPVSVTKEEKTLAIEAAMNSAVTRRSVTRSNYAELQSNHNCFFR